MRPWLNWIEQQISNLWVAGSSPAGRARKNTTVQVVFFCARRTRTGKSCVSNEGSTKSRFCKRSKAKSLRMPRRGPSESAGRARKKTTKKVVLLFFCNNILTKYIFCVIF